MAGNESKVILDFVIRGIGDAKKEMSEFNKMMDSLKGKVGSMAKSFNDMSKSVKASVENMNKVKTGAKKAGTEVKKAGEDIKKAGANAKKASVSFKEMAQEIGDLGRGLALIGAAVTAAFATSAKEAIAFEEAMYNINAIAKVSQEELGRMAHGARELAKSLEVRDTAVGVANAMHLLTLSGIESSKALDIAGVAAKAAAAGMSDTKTAVKALSALMNSYNQKTVKDSIRFSDQLFKVVERGILTFEGLAENLGAVTAIAAPMGIAFDEIGAAYIEITRAGVSVAEAETAIASLLRQLGAPSKTAKANAKELGLEIGSTALKSKGLAGMLRDLMEATGGNEEAIKRIIPDWRGMKALLALMKNEGMGFADSLREVELAQEGVGATQKALNEQMKATAFQLAQLKAYWVDLKIELGNIITKAGLPFIQVAKSIIAAFIALPDSVKNTIVALTALTATIGALGASLSVLVFLVKPLVPLLGALFKKVTLVSGGFTATMSVLSALTPVIFVVIGVLGTLYTLIKGIDGALEYFSGTANLLSDSLKQGLVGTVDWLGEKLGKLKDKFMEFISAVKFWADTKAEERATKIRLENANQVLKKKDEMQEQAVKHHKKRLNLLKEELDRNIESINKAAKAEGIKDDIRDKRIQKAKEAYENQKKFVEQSDVLTVDQMRKVIQAYDVIIQEGPGDKPKQMALRKQWVDRLNKELAFKKQYRQQQEMRLEQKSRAVGGALGGLGADKEMRSGKLGELDRLERKFEEDRMKRLLDEYGFRAFVANEDYKERLQRLDDISAKEKQALDKDVKNGLLTTIQKNQQIRELDKRIEQQKIAAAKAFQAILVEITMDGIEDEKKLREKAQKEANDAIKDLMNEQLQDLKTDSKEKAEAYRHDIEMNKQRYAAGEIFAKEYFDTEDEIHKERLAQLQWELVIFDGNKKEEAKIAKKINKVKEAIAETDTKRTKKNLEFQQSLWKNLEGIAVNVFNSLSASNNKFLSSLGRLGGNLTETISDFKILSDNSDKIKDSWAKLNDLSEGGLSLKKITDNADALGGVFMVANLAAKHMMKSLKQMVTAVDTLTEAMADGEVTAQEWRNTLEELTRVMPILGDMFVDLGNALEQATISIFNLFGFYTDDQIFNDYLAKIEKAQQLERNFRTEHDRYMNDKQRAVEQFYKEYEHAINEAYDLEVKRTEEAISAIDDRIQEYKDGITALKEELDKLLGRDFRQQTREQFERERQMAMQGLDPDFFRDPVTHFQLTRQEIEENLEAAFIRGEISLEEMNKKLAEDAIKRNIYYTEIADDLVDGTREQLEYIKLANEAYADYADIVKNAEKNKIEGNITWIEDQIKSQEVLKKEEEDRLDALKTETDAYIKFLDDGFKDMWGNFKDMGIDAIEEVFKNLQGFSTYLSSIGMAQMTGGLIGELGEAQARAQAPTYDTSFATGITLEDAVRQADAQIGEYFNLYNEMAQVVYALQTAFATGDFTSEETGKLLKAANITYEQYQSGITEKEGIYANLLPIDPMFKELFDAAGILYADGGVADKPSIFGEAGVEAAFTAKQVKGMYDYIIHTTTNNSGGGMTINVGQVVANNPQQFTQQLKASMPYIQKQLGRSYRNTYSN
jgi:TP901 family phage tail tape measure protein